MDLNETKIIYIFINLLLLLTFVLGGYNIKRGDSYWKNALSCSFVFILVMGTRYGRGNDYFHYVEVYLNGDNSSQYSFLLFNGLLKNILGIGRYFIFYVYAIPFILCGFKFLKNFQKIANIIFPLFLISMTYFEEYEIRQALSFSFVFLFMDTFLNIRQLNLKKVSELALYFMGTLLIHSANILFIIVFLGLIYGYRKVINYKVAIPLLLFCAYVFVKYYDISYIMPILNLLGGLDQKFAQYSQGNAAEAWFGTEAFQLENARNPLIQFMEIVGNSSLFYFSYKLIKNKNTVKDKSILSFTNMYILGYCGKQAFLYLEILNRMSGLFQRMWFIPLSVVLTTIRFSKLSLIEKIMYISMILVMYDYLKYLFFPNPNMDMFLWDKPNLF